MENVDTQDLIFGQIRTAAATIGGALVTQGVIGANTLNIVLGIISIVVPFVLSVVAKYLAAQKQTQAVAVAVQTGVVAVQTGAVDPAIPITPKFAAALIEKLGPNLPEVKPLSNPLKDK